MEYKTLSNGVQMPILGYGVYQVAKDECERCVSDAFRAGYGSPRWWKNASISMIPARKRKIGNK